MNSALVPPAGEYALRAAVCLVPLPPEGWMTAKDIAQRANVPPAFLAKVLRRLVQAGLLHGQRGHHGGFRLARAPATIRVADVLQAADVALTAGGCAFGFARCDAAAPCPLHDTYASLHLMLQAWARSTTLADIDLQRLPALPAPEPA